MSEMLSDAQVQSVLNQLDADLNTILTQRRGLAQIKGVMLAYIEAKKTLEGLETTQKVKENDLASLDNRIDAKTNALMKVFNERKEKYEGQIKDFLQKVEEANNQSEEADADLAAKETFTKTRSEQLNEEIKAKSKELETLNVDLATLKKRHAIA